MSSAMIFDFDGVLVMSERARFSVLQKIAKSYDLEIPDELFKHIIGRTSRDFFDSYLPNIDKAVLQEVLLDYQHEYKDKITDYVTPIAATTDFIKDYEGQKLLAVTSGSDTNVLDMVLKDIGIYHKFAVLVGKEHVLKHKPDPEAYILTAHNLGVPVQNCIVIEDSVVGVSAAQNAQMSPYVFLNGLNSRSKVAGFIETLEDLNRLAA